ncbi:hypothetical protein ACFQ60_48055 [Streptomyces zhihengii]
MIEQAYLEAADVTNPPVASLRARIGAAIDSSPAPGTGTVLDRVSFWLQLPTDTTVAGMLDKLCEARGKRVGTALSSAAAGVCTIRRTCRRPLTSRISGPGSASVCMPTAP